MAEAFVKKIEDFLSCSICFEQLKDPVGLPCLHGFCYECLQDWHKAGPDKSKVVCPACKKTTLLPEDGIRGFPGHFLVNNLKETVHMEKQKVDSGTCSEIQVGDKVFLEDTVKDGIVKYIDGEDAKVVDSSGEMWTGKVSTLQLVSTDTPTSAPCDLCDKPAESHCLDCKQYLCKQCHKQHNAFKLMKDHKVVAAKDVLSGKVSSQGRHCPVHGEMIRFYCNSEDKQVCNDCITLKTCAISHDRVSLSEAAKKQSDILKQLISPLEEKRETYLSYLSNTAKMRVSLDTSYKKTSKDFEMVITETTEKLQELLQKKRVILTKEFSTKDKQLNDAQGELKSKVSSSQKACSLANDVVSRGSDYDITFKYSTLKTTMEGIVSSKVDYGISESLGKFSFEPGKPEDYINLTSDSLACKENKQENPPSSDGAQTTRQASDTWKLSNNFKTNGFRNLRDIAIIPNGELVIVSQGNGARIYSPMRTFMCTLKCAPRHVNTTAVTPDGRIIIDGNNKLLSFNLEGKQLSPITTMSSPVAVAVDKSGRIVVGMSDDTISIHYSDGSRISWFDTSNTVHYISTSSQNTLVVTLLNDHKTGVLQVMTYSGSDITEIQPPHQIEWDPGYTCCNSRDEIFVINDAWENYIFWFTHAGQYLGCVTSDVVDPKGLTVSTDDELIVAEENGTVNYFLKPQ